MNRDKNARRRMVRERELLTIASAFAIRDMMRDDRWGRASWGRTMEALLKLGAMCCDLERARKGVS